MTSFNTHKPYDPYNSFDVLNRIDPNLNNDNKVTKKNANDDVNRKINENINDIEKNEESKKTVKKSTFLHVNNKKEADDTTKKTMGIFALLMLSLAAIGIWLTRHFQNNSSNQKNLLFKIDETCPNSHYKPLDCTPHIKQFSPSTWNNQWNRVKRSMAQIKYNSGADIKAALGGEETYAKLPQLKPEDIVQGITGYVHVKPSAMKSSIMKGTDEFGRELIAMKYKDIEKGTVYVHVFFQRYGDDKANWVSSQDVHFGLPYNWDGSKKNVNRLIPLLHGKVIDFSGRKFQLTCDPAIINH
jgi:hypothetical protein